MGSLGRSATPACRYSMEIVRSPSRFTIRADVERRRRLACCARDLPGDLRLSPVRKLKNWPDHSWHSWLNGRPRRTSIQFNKFRNTHY